MKRQLTIVIARVANGLTMRVQSDVPTENQTLVASTPEEAAKLSQDVIEKALAEPSKPQQ